MSLKSQIHSVIINTCKSQLFRPLAIWSAKRTNNIVYLHYVGEPFPHYSTFYNGYNIDQFAKSIEKLSQTFIFVPLSEIVESNTFNHHNDKPLISLTFDDGFDLCNTGVLEVLDLFKVKATTFLITSCIDNHRLMWRHKLSVIIKEVLEKKCLEIYNGIAKENGLSPIHSSIELLEISKMWNMAKKDKLASDLWVRCGLPDENEYLEKYKPYFTKNNLEKWLSAGHSIGFHSHTHPICSKLSNSEIEDELIQPALKLKALYNIKELPMSYPFGDRLSREIEKSIVRRKIFSTMLGIKGFGKKGIANEHLERVGIESDKYEGLVYKALLRRIL